VKHFDPAPYNKEYEFGEVENRDFTPFVIKSVLDQNEIDYIYELIEQFKDKYLEQKFVGHKAWTFRDEKFSYKLNKIISEAIGQKMILREYSFAKYSTDFGYKPKLFPHYDTHQLDGQRITVDIQMNKNIDWPVVVEGKSFVFDPGDALVFSGTQQLHWREKMELNQGDEVDMIFAHFAYADSKPWSPMQGQILEYHAHRLRESLNMSNQPEPISGFGV
jgi:hypothetical protein